MRLQLAIGVLTVFLFCACAGTIQYSKLPTVTDPARAAKIYFIRPSRGPGAAAGWDVRIDGFPVAIIGNGEHAIITVPSGMRTIGSRDMNLTVEVNPRDEQFYELYITSNSLYLASDVNFRRVSEVEGKRLVSQTKPLN